MIGGDPASVASMFHAASIGATRWADALAGLAGLTGAFTGELLGFGRANALNFYCHNAIAPELLEDFKAARGYDPMVNSRVRIANQAPPLRILDERDFTTARDIELYPEYGEYLRRIDCMHLCASVLIKQDGLVVGLSVVRTQAQGHVSDVERRAFADVMPHVRAAVQTQMMLEGRQLSLVADTFERMAACAMVCDAEGRLLAVSASADALLREGGWLTVRDGMLVAQTPNDSRRLARALFDAAGAGIGAASQPPPFTIRNEIGELLPLEALPYVAPHSLGPGTMAILIAKPPRDLGAAASEVGRLIFQLTTRESTIAGELVRGRTVAEIADLHGTAIGTVRVHLRNIFEKVGVHNQAQMIARLCSYN